MNLQKLRFIGSLHLSLITLPRELNMHNQYQLYSPIHNLNTRVGPALYFCERRGKPALQTVKLYDAGKVTNVGLPTPELR